VGRLLRYADMISSKAILNKAIDVIADVYIQLVLGRWQTGSNGTEFVCIIHDLLAMRRCYSQFNLAQHQ
jgi:hypothetical protein